MISVCMATHNGGKYIKEQIDSILVQISNEDELIISDDSSTDDTVEIIKKIKDKRIKLFENNKFFSPNLNFENALLHSKGDIIFLSDQDDIWKKDKVKIMGNYLDKYDLVISDSVIVDENLNLLYESSFKKFKSKKGIIKNIYKNSYYGCCMAFNRRILNLALPFPNSQEIGHDLWIGMIAELSGKVLFLDKKLIFFRRHSQTYTNSGESRSRRKLSLKIIGRIIIITEILKYKFFGSGGK